MNQNEPKYISAPPKEGKVSRKNLHLALAFIGGLVIGILLTLLVVGPSSEVDKTTEETEEVGDVSVSVVESENEDEVIPPAPSSFEGIVPSQDASDVVQVKDQEAGQTVFVSRLELEDDGWVAIHEDASGALGNILGAARFDPGVHQDEVTLLRPTTPDAVYHAVVWLDDGDKEFDHTSDTPLLNEEGELVSMQFETF